MTTTDDLLARPATIGAEAYVSPDYARAEQERLWRKTWPQAGRAEDVPEVGNYITYDIGSDSVIVVRTGLETCVPYKKARSVIFAARAAVAQLDSAPCNTGAMCGSSPTRCLQFRMRHDPSSPSVATEGPDSAGCRGGNFPRMKFPFWQQFIG